MSLYKDYSTDAAMERDGVLVNYGDVRFLIARAGGSNRKFAEVFKAKAQPFRYAIDKGKLNEDDANRIMAETYAETVILGWESVVRDDNGDIVKGAKGKPKIQKSIEGKDGKQVKFTVENCTQLLLDLPDLFRDIQAMAADQANFRKEEEAEDAGNLNES